jgi:fructuronate reductase
VSGRRLAAVGDVAPGVRRPGYDPAAHGTGIVHLGLGAFHRAHQAAYTDDALAAAGGDWRIVGASLRSTEVAEALNPQNGLYTLIERGADGTRTRLIGSIARVIAAADDRAGLIAAMTDPATRIVSLTVTEKAYGIDRAAGAVDPAHPAIAADLADPLRPAGVLGLLTEALRRRRAVGIAPFTVLCCDNLPVNGALLRDGGHAGRGGAAHRLRRPRRDRDRAFHPMGDRGSVPDRPSGLAGRRRDLHRGCRPL